MTPAAFRAVNVDACHRRVLNDRIAHHFNLTSEERAVCTDAFRIREALQHFAASLLLFGSGKRIEFAALRIITMQTVLMRSSDHKRDHSVIGGPRNGEIYVPSRNLVLQRRRCPDRIVVGIIRVP